MINKEKIAMELHPSEVELINFIRNRVRYGEITLILRDGLPVRVERTVTYESFNISTT